MSTPDRGVEYWIGPRMRCLLPVLFSATKARSPLTSLRVRLVEQPKRVRPSLSSVSHTVIMNENTARESFSRGVLSHTLADSEFCHFTSSSHFYGYDVPQTTTE